jgi:aryl-alcohol dehydrogenase-like predicted oxidoreductase
VNIERAYDSIDTMRGIAEAKGVSVAQIALAWLLHQEVVTSVIIGAKRVEQLDDNIAATAVHLSAGELAALDQVSALPPEYPGWMLERQGEARREQVAKSLI